MGGSCAPKRQRVCQEKRSAKGQEEIMGQETKCVPDTCLFSWAAVGQAGDVLLSLGHVYKYYMSYISWISYKPNRSPISQYCYCFIIIVIDRTIV